MKSFLSLHVVLFNFLGRMRKVLINLLHFIVPAAPENKKSHLKEEIEEALPFSYTEKSVIFRSLPPLNL